MLNNIKIVYLEIDTFIIMTAEKLCVKKFHIYIS